jgi:hypothetical protein
MKNPMGEKTLQDYFSHRKKNPTSIFDLGMFPPFGPFWRIFSTHCLRKTLFETVSGRISSKWTKWIKHSPIENPCGIFLPYGKNNPVGFFLPWDFSWDG